MLPRCRMFKSLWQCHSGHIHTVPPRDSKHLPNPKVSLDDTTSSCKPCLHRRALAETRCSQPLGILSRYGADDPACIWGYAAKLPWLPLAPSRGSQAHQMPRSCCKHWALEGTTGDGVMGWTRHRLNVCIILSLKG